MRPNAPGCGLPDAELSGNAEPFEWRDSSPAMVETPLQMAKRHVLEGQQRIAQQEALIARLLRDGLGQLLPAARTLLTTMQMTLDELEAHFVREEREAAILEERSARERARSGAPDDPPAPAVP